MTQRSAVGERRIFARHFMTNLQMKWRTTIHHSKDTIVSHEDDPFIESKLFLKKRVSKDCSGSIWVKYCPRVRWEDNLNLRSLC